MGYSVIQWSSGNVGKHAIAAVAARADLKLKGLYVYDPNKQGADAGHIAGISAMGVKATRDFDKLLAMDADCVIHTPLPSLIYGANPEEDLDVICALLASGKHVVTTVGYLYPKSHGPKVRRRLEAACRRGGSTFHSTGVNPGWMGDMLPLMMSGMSKHIDKVHVLEITNFQYYPSPQVIFDMMGFGLSPAQFKHHTRRYRHWLSGLFRESIEMVADGLGLALDSIAEQSRYEVTKRPLKVAAGKIPKETVAGQHWEWAGKIGRRKVIVHETVWRMHESVGPDWPRGHHSVSISGQPDMHVEFGPIWNNDVLLSTALRAVNAVPLVCEAPAGIATLIDLPMVIGGQVGGRRRR